MADHNEAMRLADDLDRQWRDDALNYDTAMEAATLIRQQDERITELEAEVQEQARVNGMGAERELALIAERDQHKATATFCLALLADIRMACGDNGKRMQPELVEFIGAMTTERDQLRAEVQKLKVALRMGAKAEVARAHEVVGLRAEVESLRSAVNAFCDATSWSAQSWKDQPYIKPLFDLAGTTHKDEG